CHSYPESSPHDFRLFYQRYVRCSLAKTFGHLADRAKKIEIDKALTLEHYIYNKVFVSRDGITAFAYVSTLFSKRHRVFVSPSLTNAEKPPNAALLSVWPVSCAEQPVVKREVATPERKVKLPMLNPPAASGSQRSSSCC